MLYEVITLFPRGVLDVWDCHAPLEDPGHTYSSRAPLARRDYVMLSSADSDQPLCVHHVSLAHNVAGEEGADPDEPAMTDPSPPSVLISSGPKPILYFFLSQWYFHCSLLKLAVPLKIKSPFNIEAVAPKIFWKPRNNFV